MKKLTIICGIAAAVFPSCKPNYACYCYNKGVRDTTINMGKISANEANKNCAAVNNLRPSDSCYAMQQQYK